MKIIDVKVYYIEVPLAQPMVTADYPAPVDSYRLFLARVFTDKGLIGTGAQHYYSSSTPFPELAKYMERDAKNSLTGRVVEVGHVERFAKRICSQAFGVTPCPRPCCVEIALWDLLGKEAGKPLYKLFGAVQDRVKAYASILEDYPLATKEQWVDLVERLVEEGFRAVKPHIDRGEKDPTKVIEVVEAIRAKFDDRIEIMVDAMQAWKPEPLYDLSTAIRYAKQLEEYDVRWLEEPLPHFNNPEPSTQLCEAVDMPIAGGGAMLGAHTYKTLLEKGALDIVQPDVQFAGGLSQTRKIGKLAKAYGKQCIPHCWGSGLALAATLQVIGALDVAYVEYPYHPPAFTVEARDRLLDEPLTIDADGTIGIPQGPGLGVALDEDAIRHFTAA